MGGQMTQPGYGFRSGGLGPGRIGPALACRLPAAGC